MSRILAQRASKSVLLLLPKPLKSSRASISYFLYSGQTQITVRGMCSLMDHTESASLDSDTQFSSAASRSSPRPTLSSPRPTSSALVAEALAALLANCAAAHLPPPSPPAAPPSAAAPSPAAGVGLGADPPGSPLLSAAAAAAAAAAACSASSSSSTTTPSSSLTWSGEGGGGAERSGLEKESPCPRLGEISACSSLASRPSRPRLRSARLVAVKLDAQSERAARLARAQPNSSIHTESANQRSDAARLARAQPARPLASPCGQRQGRVMGVSRRCAAAPPPRHANLLPRHRAPSGRGAAPPPPGPS